MVNGGCPIRPLRSSKSPRRRGPLSWLPSNVSRASTFSERAVAICTASVRWGQPVVFSDGTGQASKPWIETYDAYVGTIRVEDVSNSCISVFIGGPPLKFRQN